MNHWRPSHTGLRPLSSYPLPPLCPQCSPATRVSDLGATPDGKRKQFGVYVGASSFALALSKPDAQTRLAAYRWVGACSSSSRRPPLGGRQHQAQQAHRMRPSV